MFNPHGRAHHDLVLTGRIYPIPGKARALVVKNRDGQVVPSQVIASSRDATGNLLVADVAFVPGPIPPAGYDTYYLDGAVEPVAAAPTGLKIDEAKLVLENEHVRVALDPATGAVASLIHKPSGRELLDGKRGAFPHFTGRPNPNLSLTPHPPARYDSATSKAQIDWTERGPVRTTVPRPASLALSDV